MHCFANRTKEQQQFLDMVNRTRGGVAFQIQRLGGLDSLDWLGWSVTLVAEAKDCGSSRGGQAESQVGKEATREAEHSAGKGMPSGSTFETWRGIVVASFMPVSCHVKPSCQTWCRHIPFSLKCLNSKVGQFSRFRGMHP